MKENGWTQHPTPHWVPNKTPADWRRLQICPPVFHETIPVRLHSIQIINHRKNPNSSDILVHRKSVIDRAAQMTAVILLGTVKSSHKRCQQRTLYVSNTQFIQKDIKFSKNAHPVKRNIGQCVLALFIPHFLFSFAKYGFDFESKFYRFVCLRMHRGVCFRQSMSVSRRL